MTGEYEEAIILGPRDRVKVIGSERALSVLEKELLAAGFVWDELRTAWVRTARRGDG